MVDMQSINAAFLGLKTAMDMAKGLRSLDQMADVRLKVIDLQQVILEAQDKLNAAQSEQSALAKRNDDLEKEMASMKAWEKEKERYQLIEPWRGCFVYALKESSKGTDIPHWICEHCYQEGRKSLLHDTYKQGNRRNVFVKCSHCELEHETFHSTKRSYAETGQGTPLEN